MKYTSSLFLFIAFFLTISNFVLAQDTLATPTPQLKEVSHVQHRINQLEIAIPYASLRRGRYAWMYPGRWEVGLHLMPWVSQTNGFARILADEPTDFGGATIIDLGASGDRTFYDKRYEFVAIDKRPGVVFLNADLARQFHSGWRLGIGYTLYNVLRSRPLRFDEVTDLIEPGEYALFSDVRERQSFFSAEASFTFRRRRRLRPALGLVAVRPGKFVTSGRSTLVDGEDGSVIYQNDETFRRNVNDPRIYVMAKFSLQYQLSLNVTLGLEIGAPIGADTYVGFSLFGLGGRYVFAEGF
ncbi:MAG: hypothetical protein AB8H12_23620 [Lewinella sp.]